MDQPNMPVSDGQTDDQTAETEQMKPCNCEGECTCNETAEAAPVQSEAAPVQSEVAPVQSEAAPVQSEVAPVQSEVAPATGEDEAMSSEEGTTTE